MNEAFLEALGVLHQKLDFLSTSALAQVRRHQLGRLPLPEHQRARTVLWDCGGASLTELGFRLHPEHIPG